MKKIILSIGSFLILCMLLLNSQMNSQNTSIHSSTTDNSVLYNHKYIYSHLYYSHEMLFLENHEFECHSKGCVLTDVERFDLGTWYTNNDTLFMHYDRKKEISFIYEDRIIENENSDSILFVITASNKLVRIDTTISYIDNPYEDTLEIHNNKLVKYVTGDTLSEWVYY